MERIIGSLENRNATEMLAVKYESSARLYTCNKLFASQQRSMPQLEKNDIIQFNNDIWLSLHRQLPLNGKPI
jgi:hypothetical protein